MCSSDLIAGTGYVGLSSAMLLSQNHEVIALDIIPDTYADVDDLVEEFGYKPSMSVKQGVENFAVWYKDYNE